MTGPDEHSIATGRRTYDEDNPQCVLAHRYVRPLVREIQPTRPWRPNIGGRPSSPAPTPGLPEPERTSPAVQARRARPAA
jgi:hypothetical protein